MESDVKSTNLSASGAIFAGPSRVKSINWVGGSSAGTVIIRDGGSGGTILATIDTPAGTGTSGQVTIPSAGLRCETSSYCTISNTAKVTVFYA